MPSIPSFNSFLLFESPKCTEIARWNTLKTILHAKNVPYNILEGEKRNYYYHEIKDLLVETRSVYSLKSLELSEANKELMVQKRKEYVVLAQCMTIFENTFELVIAKKWRETMANIGLVHEKLNQIKVPI